MMTETETDELLSKDYFGNVVSEACESRLYATEEPEMSEDEIRNLNR